MNADQQVHRDLRYAVLREVNSLTSFEVRAWMYRMDAYDGMNFIYEHVNRELNETFGLAF